MAAVYQRSLFSWKDIEDLGGLERLHLVIKVIPDEKLMSTLEKHRKNGRDDYPVRPMWNSLLAGVVYQHSSIESLLRELQRNAQLRELCGYDPLKGSDAVPTSMAFSRFLSNVMTYQHEIDAMFNSLVASLTKELPDFGHYLAFDGKAIDSHANQKADVGASPTGRLDRRKEGDAEWGKQVYKGVNKKGKSWEKFKIWFGFKLHLIVDAKYELPVSYEVHPGPKGEQPVIRGMFDKLKLTHSKIIHRCEYAMGDKGYDGAPTINKLWNEMGIKPIIDIKNQRMDKETRLLKTSNLPNVTFDDLGGVYCHCPESGTVSKMAYCGFEVGRDAQKFRCPALEYGITCPGASSCPARKALRVPLKEDQRIFTPVARVSYKWKKLYKMRTSVERVNSRLDVSFGFENHFIKGIKKMRCRCGIALCVMLAMALGRIRQKRPELMRSLVQAA